MLLVVRACICRDFILGSLQSRESVTHGDVKVMSQSMWHSTAHHAVRHHRHCTRLLTMNTRHSQKVAPRLSHARLKEIFEEVFVSRHARDLLSLVHAAGGGPGPFDAASRMASAAHHSRMYAITPYSRAHDAVLGH